MRTPTQRVDFYFDGAMREIQELAYLGLRIAYQSSSRSALSRVARAVIQNKLMFEREWKARGPFPQLQFAGREHLEAAMGAGRGAILAAPHVGQYHRIPLAVLDLGWPISLLVDEKNYDVESDNWNYWMRQYRGALKIPITYISAQQPTACWEMAKCLGRGRALLIYLDGNSGLDGPNAAKTLTEVTFCGMSISVRKGLAYLGASTRAPIIPAVASRSRKRGDLLRFEPPCNIECNEGREAYCARAMQYCYKVLERYIRRCASCWEEWYHLQRWVVRQDNGLLAREIISRDPQAALDSGLKTEAENIELIELECGPVLVQVNSGDAIAANNYVAAFLSLATEGTTGKKLLEQLRAKGLASEAELRMSLLELIAGGFLRVVE